MNRAKILRGRIRLMTGLLIAGLLLSGLSAIPLRTQADWLVKVSGVDPSSADPNGWTGWALRVQAALHEVGAAHPFLFYGTDWLAFSHFIIAIAFVGAWRDPVRNQWLFDFGLTACALVIPFALIVGGLRGIPLWWRLIDCSFGVFGAIPLWYARRWTRELAAEIER